jgi:multisubunit Na+/H+ antiporter MnhC subunit
LLGGREAYGQWHHLLTHGFVAAIAITLVLTALARERLKVLGLSLLAFHLHLVCDLMGSGTDWPIYYFEPFSHASIGWSGGWELASWQNSVIGMAMSVLCLLCALRWRRTIVELFSLKADAQVVKAVRLRAGRRD